MSPQRAHAPFAATVAVLSVVAMLVIGQSFITIPLMPELGRAWGVTPESAAWATTVFAVTYAFGSLAGGPLSDRCGRRAILTGSVAALAVATTLVPFASDLTWGLTVRALQGVAAGSFVPMSYAYLAERIPERRLPLALTTVGATAGASAVVSQIEGQLIGGTLGWRAVFLISAPLLAAGAVALWRVLLPGPAPDAPAPGSGSDAVAGRGIKVLASARVLPLLLVAVPVLGSLTAVYTSVQLYGPAELVGDDGAMLSLRASALPAMLLAVLVAPWLGRVPALRRAAGSLGVAAIGLMAAAPAGGNTVALGVALFVFVLAVSTVGPAIVQALGASAGAAGASAMAVYGFLLNLGSGAGAQFPLLVGNLTGVAVSVAVLLAAAIGLIAVASRAAGRQARTSVVAGSAAGPGRVTPKDAAQR
ncbi:MFS transporter [Streptomyces sp. 891-h]|uniref:MFS transporter n=1 Tax=Streptomyces sp. 891-h TaxID=2720714 RepID=UPI001FA9AA93|nr:MFS transporter [Streptomyces sp. 891-h]UNZ21011.1 MFS transporter [Streptomyces sp. 891-h]